MKIPFSPPFIDEDVKREVLDCLESGWITSGPKVLALEALVGEQVGVEHVVCCNSATSGLLLMLHWFGVGKGDEVIIPAYTYAATALVVLHVGATPVMVDVDQDFNIDVATIEQKVTEKTKVIIPVDFAGWPCDFSKIFGLIESDRVRKRFKPTNEVQRKLGRIMVLSDAAHSIGAKYKTKCTGALADFTVFSFHAVKNITTAEGGAVCVNVGSAGFDNKELYKQLKLWCLNGQTKDALSKTNGGNWRYDIVYPGFKMNMPDLGAAIGLAQLRKYSQAIMPQRKRVFESYVSIFSDYSWAQLPPLDNEETTSSYHLFALRIRNITEHQRDQMIDFISEKGVSVNVHFQPLPVLKLFKDMGYSISDFPVSYDNYCREISLPIYPELNKDHINYIANTVVQAFSQIVIDHQLTELK